MSKRTKLSEIDSLREDLEIASRKRAILASEASIMRFAAPGGKRIKEAGLAGLDPVMMFREAVKREDDLKDRLIKVRNSALSASHADDVKELSSEFPIVLLPARIETRFMKESYELLVRIYPDEIAAETFEPELMDDELNAGKSYWKLAKNEDSEKEAWEAITGRYSSERAAWIVKVTTPTNISERPLSEPTFPIVDIKAQSWTRPARSRVLPDRWVVIAYRDRVEVLCKETSPVQEPLALTVDPGAEPEDVSDDVPQRKPLLDKGVVWTIDFEEAVKAGMALRLRLSEEDIKKGFDRLIAVGVKTTLSPENGGDRLADLFDSHHYSRGLAFISQGTPTNNTKSSPSGFPPSDVGGSYSFGIERGDPLVTEGSDGSIFMKALGVHSTIADHVAGAGGFEQRAAKAMNDTLWPSTIGYFLESMHGLKAGDLVGARKHFVEYVRGRGPYPAFRIGSTPYGLLPISSLSHPVNSEDSPEIGIISKVVGAKSIRSIWIEGSNKAPMIGKTSDDPDKDLLEILAMDASAQEVRVRIGCKSDFISLLMERKYDIGAWMSQKRELLDTLSGKLSELDLPLKEIDMTFGPSSYIYKRPLVSETLSETKKLDPNYIQEILDEMMDKSLDEIRSAEPAHKELLYLMLRHSILQEHDSLAWNILADHGFLTGAFRPEPEITGIEGSPEDAWKRLSKKVHGVTDDTILWEYLKNSDVIMSYRDSLSHLVSLPTAELQRLFTETLDVCSHRLDAWATSLATRRLDEMRKDSPLGSYLGGFGWLENLRPPDGTRKTVTLSDGRTVHVQEKGGGYIQAPSMDHASAAAVLRSGFLTHALDSKQSFNINLSSRRVRNARWVLESVRQGQFLGAVLGYSVERGLHERGVETLIEPLRKCFPLPEGSTNDIAGASEAIAARNVVDGLALRTAWRKNEKPFGKNGMPHSPPMGDRETKEMDALEKEVEILDDLVDSVADLLTAESVYQMIKGNTSGASASLDTMARGERPHDPEILRQPRTGTTLTHRVLMVLGGPVINADDAWSRSDRTPRMGAEEILNRWAGQMLGDPAAVKCRAEYTVTDSDGSPVEKEIEITLEKLDIRPLDFLALVSKADAGGEMNQRIADVVLKADKDAQNIKLVFAAADGWDRRSVRTFPEIIEVGRAINDVISVSRPMTPEDVLHPASAVSLGSGDYRMVEDSLSRADHAIDLLKSEKNRLERERDQMKEPGGSESEKERKRDDLIDELRNASLFGLEGAFPVTQELTIPTDAELISAAKTALKEVEARIKKASELRNKIEDLTSDAAKVDIAAQITKEVFGNDFVFLPRFMPPDPEKLGPALDAGQNQLIDPDQGVRDNILRKWVQGASRVRKPLELWRRLWLYAEALGVPAARLDVAQLPHIDDARWAALPFDGEENRPTSGNLSMVLYRPSILNDHISPKADSSWVGMVLDEWPEIIPSNSENTGIAFNYDNPGAEAPQVVLIAVPEYGKPTWDLKSVIEAVSDTMDMSMMRLCNLEMIDELAQLLPAILLASNKEKDAISLDLSKERIGDPKSDGGV